jgi:DNA recombination protein RmuC
MLYLIFIILAVLFAIFVWFIFDMKKKMEGKDTGRESVIIQEKLAMLLDENRELRRAMDSKLTETHSASQRQYSESAKMIGDITEKLTSLEKTNQQVIGFSEQLSNLEKVLKHQKQRGNLGEAGLKMVLENILPPDSFKLQYQFPDNDTVDAAIFTKEGIIPVDAKFSLDNYERLIHEDNEERKNELENEFKKDLKKRIDETAKYIKPKYDTLEFAFMFIPAEAIYYDLLINEVGAVKVNTRSLIDYAFIEKRVIIVSPTTFSAYLHTVIQGLQALKIEEGAKVIRKNVEALNKHMLSYEDYLIRLRSSLSTSVNHFNSAYKEFGKIDKDVVKIIGGESKIEPIMIEKPEME